jgi:sugar phosphate isomerase/epimerase
MVRYPEFIAKLKEIGFTGELIIEREISEKEGQNQDIIDTVEYLKKLI